MPVLFPKSGQRYKGSGPEAVRNLGEEENKMAMVSVIIPVYNAEKYIRECLESLLRQTYPDFEIICVDDGSQDGSPEILRMYEERDSRISVLVQQNQYAGVARNAGMERAKGKYLLFLDADDFFCEDMLEEVVREAEENRTEILVFDAYRYDEVHKEIRPESWAALSAELFGDGIRPAAEIADVIYRFTTPSPWNKLFLKEYIEKNALRFQEIKRANDLFFTFAALSCAERIGVLRKKLMYYRTGNAQSLQGSADDTPAVFALAAYALQDFLQSRKLWETFQTGFHDMAVSLCVNNLGNMKSEEAYVYLFEKLKNDVIPHLETETEMPDSRLVRAVGKKKKIIVYGAGMLASVFVRMLITKYGYEKEGLLVAVSSKADNGSLLCGVRVQEIKELSDKERGYPVVIAIAKESVQNEVEAALRAGDFENILKLGYREMLGLIQYGVEAEAE